MNYIVRRNTVVLATTDSLATVKHLFWLHAHGNKNAVVSVREASPTGLGTCLAEHTGGRSAGFNNLDKQSKIPYYSEKNPDQGLTSGKTSGVAYVLHLSYEHYPARPTNETESQQGK